MSDDLFSFLFAEANANPFPDSPETIRVLEKFKQEKAEARYNFYQTEKGKMYLETARTTFVPEVEMGPLLSVDGTVHSKFPG